MRTDTAALAPPGARLQAESRHPVLSQSEPGSAGAGTSSEGCIRPALKSTGHRPLHSKPILRPGGRCLARSLLGGRTQPSDARNAARTGRLAQQAQPLPGAQQAQSQLQPHLKADSGSKCQTAVWLSLTFPPSLPAPHVLKAGRETPSRAENPHTQSQHTSRLPHGTSAGVAGPAGGGWGASPPALWLLVPGANSLP